MENELHIRYARIMGWKQGIAGIYPPIGVELLCWHKGDKQIIRTYNGNYKVFTNTENLINQQVFTIEKTLVAAIDNSN